MAWFGLTNGLATTQCAVRAHQMISSPKQRGFVIALTMMFGMLLGSFMAIPIVEAALPNNWG